MLSKENNNKRFFWLISTFPKMLLTNRATVHMFGVKAIQSD